MAPDWSKIGRRSRRKGQRFERKIAKVLTKATGLTWRRTPASGGMEWKGDVICTDLAPHQQPFIVECKDRGIRFDAEYINNYPTLEKWIDVYGSDDLVYLVFTTNNGITLVYGAWGQVKTLDWLAQQAEILTRVHRRQIEDGTKTRNSSGRSLPRHVPRHRPKSTKAGKGKSRDQ